MDFGVFIQAVKDGGWVILFVYFLYREVWPLFTTRILPAQFKAQADRDKARSEELEHDRNFREEIEKGRAEAAKITSGAILEMSKSMVQIATQQTQILANQALLIQAHNITNDKLAGAIEDMKDVSSHMVGLLEGKRLPKTGPITDDKP